MRTLPPDHDLDHLRAALEHVTDWSVAIDGGAHTGGWTRVMAERFGQVHAFEPVTWFRPPDLPENVKWWPFALGNRVGQVSMQPGPQNDGQYHITDGTGQPITTVDMIFPGMESCGLLKLDVEGYEWHALMGALETLERCRPVVVVEKNGLCRRYGVSDESVSELLMAQDYRMVERLNKDEVWTP